MKRVFLINCLLIVSLTTLLSQDHPGSDRGYIDKMRDNDLQPEKIMAAIKLSAGMIVGEAGAGSGYFIFYL
jgi:predicted methyltransferase